MTVQLRLALCLLEIGISGKSGATSTINVLVDALGCACLHALFRERSQIKPSDLKTRTPDPGSFWSAAVVMKHPK